MRAGLASTAVLVLAMAGAGEARKRHDEGPLVSLTVACATPGASVFVDGELVGYTPIDLPVPVPPGEHTIKVTRLGYAPFIDVFATRGRSAVKVELELVPVSGVVHVKSNVAGARVMVDGRYVGEAPIDLEVEVGARNVQVVKGGYRDFARRIDSVAGQEADLEARLEELPPELNPYKPLPTPPPKWYQRKWVWATVAGGAVLIAGGVTAGAILSTRTYDVCEHADVCYH